MNFNLHKLYAPIPDKPVQAKRKSRFIGELKTEDCQFNVCGGRSRSAGACAACRYVLFRIERIP